MKRTSLALACALTWACALTASAQTAPTTQASPAVTSQSKATGKERARLAKAQNVNCKDGTKQKQEKQKKAAAT